MKSLVLAAWQGLGEYGALSGASSGGTATVASKFAQATTWVSDHQVGVIIGVVVGGAFLWWVTSPRT